MKYLKNFEELKNKIIESINKKYIIIQITNHPDIKLYYLLELFEKSYYFGNYSVSCKKMWTLYNNKLLKNKQQYYNIENDNNKELIFQSNDYQHILDIFKSLKDTDKYNL